jgi:hypothetical protein
VPKAKSFRHKILGGRALSFQEGTKKSFEGCRKGENLQGLNWKNLRRISIVAQKVSARSEKRPREVQVLDNEKSAKWAQE